MPRIVIVSAGYTTCARALEARLEAGNLVGTN